MCPPGPLNTECPYNLFSQAFPEPTSMFPGTFSTSSRSLLHTVYCPDWSASAKPPSQKSTGLFNKLFGDKQDDVPHDNPMRAVTEEASYIWACVPLNNCLHKVVEERLKSLTSFAWFMANILDLDEMVYFLVHEHRKLIMFYEIMLRYGILIRSLLCYCKFNSLMDTEFSDNIPSDIVVPTTVMEQWQNKLLDEFTDIEWIYLRVMSERIEKVRN